METEHPKMMKLRYIGPPKKGGKVVDLPIPFISKSESHGQVVCDPIGEFEWEDAQKLLAIAPEIFVKAEDNEQKASDPHLDLPLCKCGCGKMVSKEGNRFILGHSTKFPKAPSQPQLEA